MTLTTLEIIKLHFAKKHNHPVNLIEVENINFDGKNYTLDFNLDYGDWVRHMWGNISHSEVLEDMRDYKIKQLDI